MDAKEVFNKYFKEEQWSGRPKYQCKVCPFDTLSKEKAIAHLTKHLFNEIPVTRIPEKLNDTLSSLPPKEEEIKEKVEKIKKKKKGVK